MMVIEAYSNLKNTMEYYKHQLLPFNFGFITNLNSTSSAEEFKREIDTWMNSMPSGEIANWVVRIHMKLLIILIKRSQINCICLFFLQNLARCLNCFKLIVM